MITPVNQITFGYKHLLKTYWLKGKIPSVSKGFYGGDLTKDTVTLEHIRPHSKGGKTVLNNLALSQDIQNWTRGNKPIKDVFNQEIFEQYCEQFKGVKLPYFNGDDYIKQITKTVEKLLKEGK